MRFQILTCVLLLQPMTVFAEGDCRALFDKLNAEAPGDASNCDVPIKPYDLEKCTTPTTFTSERPPSHVVLMLDASGSMAGKVKGESKMKIAKREAKRFLTVIQDDVPVGLMVYGHGGNNTKSGKEESCRSFAWAHQIGSSHQLLAKGINSIKPTGYTPLAGVLEFAQSELAKINYKDKDMKSVPVVYLISDGKETCGGDPVAAAQALHESGVKAAINVIGFDVDDKTRSQLEAISKAGGGKYFPADDSKALRKQLNAARESAISMNRYNQCELENIRKVEFSHYNANAAMISCYGRENKRKRLDFIFDQAKAFATEADKSCIKDVKQFARLDYGKNIQAQTNRAREIIQSRTKAVNELKENNLFKPLKKK